MDIVNFIRDMLPSFTKKDVREKLRIIARKISDVIQPSLELIAQEINEASVKSAYAKGFLKDFLAMLPPRLRNGQNPYFTILNVALNNASKLVEHLDNYVGKNLPETVNIEGLTYQKGSVLRLIELLDFFTDYASRQLAYLIASETNIEAFDRPDGKPYTQAELNYINNNLGAYLKMLDLLYNDPKKLMTQIESIPEIIMGDTPVGEVPALAGAAADPLYLGSIPGISNAFHWVGLRKVDYDIERYEKALKEKRDIANRLESLRMKRSGNPDAQAEAIIDGYERELTLVRAKIARYEEMAR